MDATVLVESAAGQYPTLSGEVTDSFRFRSMAAVLAIDFGSVLALMYDNHGRVNGEESGTKEEVDGRAIPHQRSLGHDALEHVVL